jgi:acetyl-CoA carboxylase biotin carboxylase subunit
MGIRSVAVYSEADKHASYLAEASEAVCVGPPKAIQSYLCEEKLLRVALDSECEALHPGYGFLSENARFAARCKQQKLTFIGPSSAHLHLMGDKAQARACMAALGIPVLRGSESVIEDIKSALNYAETIGYPILLKARAGGGGKGMRLVQSAHELSDAWAEAQREAHSAFGDEKLYIEKFVPDARHIEFQVLGDSYKNILILGERECSIQRKNQKLLEEGPVSNLEEKTREHIYTQIGQALKHLAYMSAGTLEFLLGADNKLYFMEMNTRLQVEHAVTELITGLDIVEWQIRIALNEPLPFSQENIKIQGHALECRINAEDPYNNFMPSPGLITKLHLPSSSIVGPVRIDTHIEEGFTIVPFYDSMIAKIITHAATRADAIKVMTNTLNKIRIEGIKTTLDFQKAILAHPDFIKQRYNCSFVEKNLKFLGKL